MRNLPMLAATTAATAFIAVGFGRMPYTYYSLLRIVVCGACVVGAVRARRLRYDTWTWALGAVALLYNPVLPIHLGRGAKDTWAWINAGTVALLWVGAVALRKSPAAATSGQAAPVTGVPGRPSLDLILHRALSGTPEERTALRDDPDPVVRAAVAEHGSAADRAVLIRDPDPTVRRAVGMYGSSEDRALLRSDPDVIVRATASQPNYPPWPRTDGGSRSGIST